MNESDAQLKQQILAQPTPALSADFVERTWLRVQPALGVQPQAQLAWAGGLSPAFKRSHLGTWSATLLLALILAGWGVQHMWQSHADDELYRLDPVGMSSLLTL